MASAVFNFHSRSAPGLGRVRTCWRMRARAYDSKSLLCVRTSLRSSCSGRATAEPPKTGAPASNAFYQILIKERFRAAWVISKRHWYREEATAVTQPADMLALLGLLVHQSQTGTGRDQIGWCGARTIRHVCCRVPWTSVSLRSSKVGNSEF
jgi:hypothetical protein